MRRKLKDVVLLCFVVISMAQLAACKNESATNETQSTAELVGTKWHPGHYMFLPKSISDLAGLENALISIADIPELRGIQLRVYWYEIETGDGVYDASAIDAALALAKQYDKYLVFQITERCWNCVGGPLTPSYITTDPVYNGGVYIQNGVDQFSQIFDPLVMAQFNKMIRWLGENYDNHPYLEAINFQESAYPCKSIPECLEVDYTGQLIGRIANAKQYFKHTNVIQYANWINNIDYASGRTVDDALTEIMDEVRRSGAGWGGPDTLPYLAVGKTTYNSTIPAYSYYATNAADIPLGGAIQAAEMNGAQGIFTAQELFYTAVDELKLNYVFWISRENSANYPALISDVPPPTAGQVHQNIVDSGISQSYIDSLPTMSVLSYIKSQQARANTVCPNLIAPCITD